jgi:hypothetical protein
MPTETKNIFLFYEVACGKYYLYIRQIGWGIKQQNIVELQR